MQIGEVPADWRNQRIAVQASFAPTEDLPQIRFLDVEAYQPGANWNKTWLRSLPTTAIPSLMFRRFEGETAALRAESESGHSSIGM